MTDPIADFLTRLRNAIKANHQVVEVPSSKLKEQITRVLHENGYILDFKVDQDGVKKTLKVALKYHPVTKLPAITSLKRVSRPGLRRYSSVESMPRVINGLGIAILTTSQGIMTDKQAKVTNVGGEVLCYVY